MVRTRLESVWQLIRFTLCKLFKIKGHGISILVPAHLTESDSQRLKNWQWLKEYWKSNLPGAEIIIGTDKDADRIPFSKSVAVNDAASKAHGDVFVIVDADVYISAETVIHCAEEIRKAENKGHTLWFMPYRKLFRLTREVTEKFLAANPKEPIEFSPSPGDYSNLGTFEDTPNTQIGHWYGAMIQVMSRKAFYTVGGWDPRFRGWGCEDHAAMVAMDTLYGPHKTLPVEILHLWHPVLTPNPVDDPKGKNRLWANQDSSSSNGALSGRYYWSKGNPKRMRSLVNEFLTGVSVNKPNQQREQKRPVSSNFSS